MLAAPVSQSETGRVARMRRTEQRVMRWAQRPGVSAQARAAGPPATGLGARREAGPPGGSRAARTFPAETVLDLLTAPTTTYQ